MNVAPPFPRTERARIVLGWTAAVALGFAVLARFPGVSEPEASTFGTADRIATFWGTLPAHPVRAAAALDDAFGRVPRPPLADATLGAVHAVLAPLGEAWSHRLGTVAWAALLTALLAALGLNLAGPVGGLLAPALLWVAPRTLQLGITAGPDVAEAALWLAALAAWRAALGARSAAARVPSALAVAIAVGAAAASRADGWVLLPLLGASTLLLALHAQRLARRVAANVEETEHGSVPRTRGALLALALTLVAVPAIGLATWPWLWRAPLHRLALALHPLAVQSGAAGPVAGLAHALPAALLAVLAGGVVHAVARVVRAVRVGDAAAASDDGLLLLLAVAPLALASAGLAGAGPGIRAAFPALPVLALLGARALASAGAALAPDRPARAAAAVAVFALWPAAHATLHHFPHGAAAWGELAGGAPGAASRGLPRQDGGEAIASLLPDLSEHARPGARIWWGGLAPEAVRAYRHDGRVRPDLLDAAAPEEADVALVAVDGRSRAADARAWTAFRTARPAAGAFVDEVPLAWLYARPGAWR